MKNQMAGRLILAIITVSVCWCCVANAQKVETMNVAPVETDYSKLASGLEQSGLMYRKIRANFWEVTYKTSEKGPDRYVVISADNDVVITLLVIGQLAEKTPADMYQKIAELNNKYYFIKFVYDKQNLYLRIDSSLRNVDGLMLNDIISRMAMALEKEKDTLAAFVQNPSAAPEKKQPQK